MKSMTGYGRGDSSQAGFKITVEVSSVNRRQMEIAVNLPRDLELLEGQIRDEVNRLVSRGRINVRVALHSGAGATADLRINKAAAFSYLKEFQRMGRELKLPGPITLEMILQAPGVLENDITERSSAEHWPTVEKALDRALSGLIQMRKREGRHLAKDLTTRMKTIRMAVARIRAQAPKVQVRYRDNLRERIRQAGLETPAPDDERLIKEVVYFAERSDVTEELTRLESHFQQFDDCLKSEEPVGRTLDFLSQEMNREINTIGSKANDAVISREVVLVKAELERFREQVQNVE
jgi:uncharacterized protein (TIGR00255 family)